MRHGQADERHFSKCGTPRQIAADWEINTFNYYDFTTTQNSKNVKCSYAAEIFHISDNNDTSLPRGVFAL